MRWAEHTTPEIVLPVQRNALVIMPLGCIEQHAAYLPVDTDTYQVERLSVEGAQKAAEQHGMRVLVWPAPCLAARPHRMRTEQVRAPQLRRVWERYRQAEVFVFSEVRDACDGRRRPRALGRPDRCLCRNAARA